MDFLPVFLNLRDRPCVVIGGGEVGARKVSLLLEAGAKVTVYDPDLGPSLAALRDAGRIAHRAERFRPEVLDQCVLAIAATGDETVNRAVHEAAVARRIPVNVVDQPALCTFIMPSIIDRSPVVAAVSSGGRSPVLARLIRARLESLIPAAYGRLAKLVEGTRSK